MGNTLGPSNEPQETGRGRTHSISLGIGDKSYVLHDSGIDVFRNSEQGLIGTDLRVLDLSSSRDTLSSPKKGVLMNKEEAMMLMSPSNVDNRATGVQQLELATGTIVARWKFREDIAMLDISGYSKSSQMDPSSSFVGLDSNSLYRWDARTRKGRVQDISSSSNTVEMWSEHDFAKDTNFRCFATSGFGDIAVGLDGGQIRVYGSNSIHRSNTKFPGLGQASTHIDVSFGGKWVLGTTDDYLIVICTEIRGNDEIEIPGYKARKGYNIAAPRRLKLNNVDTQQVGEGSRYQKAYFSWVTELDRTEMHVVATVGQWSVVWDFNRVVQREHNCYQQQGQDLRTCFCYKVFPYDSTILESRFMNDNLRGSTSPSAPLVVITPDHATSFYPDTE